MQKEVYTLRLRRVVSQLYNFDTRQHPSTGGRVSAKASTRCPSVHLNLQRAQHLDASRLADLPRLETRLLLRSDRRRGYYCSTGIRLLRADTYTLVPARGRVAFRSRPGDAQCTAVQYSVYTCVYTIVLHRARRRGAHTGSHLD